MRKAKVVAIVCGMIASCLFGGFAVVEAATITLDDSSTTELAEIVETAAKDTTEGATTVTSIKTPATAATSTTTIFESDETEEPTAATLETTPETTSAASIMTAAAEAKAAHTTAIEIKFPAKATAAETTAVVKATTKATTQTTTVAVTAPVRTEAVTEPVKVQEVTNPPMPEQTVVETVPMIDDSFVFEIPAISEEPVVVVTSPASISESDYILLCNAVAHEAGANSIDVTEKAKVVEVIMNRVNSPNYPNTVYDVLTQKYQFSGSSTYVNLGAYSKKVTDLVKEAVDLYFADPSAFNDGYLSFTGDGVRNYFK